jgi:hypothetical protein
MVKLWRQSEDASGTSRPNVRVISKADFLALSEEDRGEFLDDFVIVKDINVPSEFLPQLASIFQHCVAHPTDAL